MADPPPTRLHIDPPIEQWQVTPRNGRTSPIIATGHQPTLWHPGILAKDLAADAFAKHVGGSALHVVVEHNPLGELAIDVPTQEKPALGVQRIVLDRHRSAAQLPPNRLPAIQSGQAIQVLQQHADNSALPDFVVAGLHRLANAWPDADGTHLGAQTTALLAALKRPYLHREMRTLSTSALVTPAFVQRLLADPLACMRCYNRAAIAYPESGIRPLYVGRDVVEVPLWAQDTDVSVPVYVDLGDGKTPLLFTEDSAVDLSRSDAMQMLRPRAATLSAIMRSELCDLFIHGTGGGVYDQVTERWWHDWTGEALAPKAVVSADVYLPFDAPTATPTEHAKAQWFAHHLRHNVDRYAELNADHERALSQEKRELLDHMNDDRDKRRRAKAFRRIHVINAELARRHAVQVDSARQRAEDAGLGLANASIAVRRDWCFALYPDEAIDVLRQSILASINQ